MKPKLLLLILGCSTLLVSCQTSTLSPKMRSYYQAEPNIKTNVLCQSFNLGDNLRPQLDSTSLQLNLPVARFNNLAQGRAVVILPVNDSSIRLFWVRQDSQGKWSIADKQTVMQVQPGLLDASNSPHEPDFWNVAIVGVLGTFYLASLVSTYVSSSLLLYLLSGGAGIAIPLFGTQIAITEAVALMGTGILEGTSLSDAYLDHKKFLTGNRQWISRFGRFMAFVAQGLLYYMALGQLLFAAADVSSLGTQGLSDQQSSSDSQAAMVLEPPTVLHGAFVGTVSFAWSFGTTYIGPTALLVAIDRLRRKQIQKAQPSPQTNSKDGGQSDIQPLLNYWHDQISKEIQLKLYNKLIEHQVEEMKLLQRAIDRGLVEIANLPEQVRRYGLSIAQNTPKELLEKAKLTPAQAAKIFQQPTIASLPTNVAKNP